MPDHQVPCAYHAVLGASPEVATLAVMYLRVRCCACPAFLLYNVGTGNFRGRKDTRTPLLAYITTNSMCAAQHAQDSRYGHVVVRTESLLPAEGGD